MIEDDQGNVTPPDGNVTGAEALDDSLSPQARWNAAHPLQLFWHQIVRSALKRGLIEKGPCSVEGCEDGEVEAHHEDYDRPFDVIWFCRRHHQQHHAAKRAEARDAARGEAA